jgi:uncharacterized membrane protein YfcA
MWTTLAFSFVPPQATGPWHFFLVGSLSAMIMGAAKAGFAGSVGALAVPILLYACGQDAAVALGMMLPLLIACDYVALVYWRGKWDWHNVRMLLPGLLVGIAVGSVVLWLFLRLGQGQQGKEISNAALKLTIGGIALGFVALQGVRALRGGLKAFRPVPWHGFAAGSAAGVTSTLSHSAGPITTMFLLPQNMPKGRYVATTTLYYWIGNQAKLLPYWLLGQLNRDSLGGALALAPAVIAGALLGLFLHNRVNQKWFSLIVYVLLVVVGTDLVVRALASLWG